MMGVMGCYRKDCEDIMCDTYIPVVGYICGECQREFKEYLIVMNEDENNMSKRSILLRLQTFMKTPKDNFSNNEIITVEDFFNEHR
jgi:hypothetical protein